MSDVFPPIKPFNFDNFLQVRQLFFTKQILNAFGKWDYY
jgi:hypothetical protein